MKVVDSDAIWSRGGVPVEQLPDPFAPQHPRPLSEDEQPPQPEPRKRRRWVIWFYAISGLIALTVAWLVITAPLSRALEPLDDPALLLVTDDGHAIARRGAVKEAPVDVARLDPVTPAAFVSIEDRRFYRHWGIDPRGIGRAFVSNMRGGAVRQGGSTITQQLAKTNFLSSDRTYRRKAQEVIIAFWLDAWRNPTYATRPRRYPCDSLSLRNSSMTLRVMMRKSPVSRGMFRLLRRLMTRYATCETTRLTTVSPFRDRRFAYTTS